MILPEDAPVGVPFADYYQTADTVLDCEITPNRPDCLSMMGMAQETSAIFDRDTHIELPQILHEDTSVHVEDLVEVRIDAPELCSRYTARVVRGVKIGPLARLARRARRCRRYAPHQQRGRCHQLRHDAHRPAAPCL